MSKIFGKLAVFLLCLHLVKANISYVILNISSYNCVESMNSFVKLLDVSLEECVEACVRRQTCKSVGYRRRMNFCELHKEDVFVLEEDEEACIFIERIDMNTPEADKCTCSHVGHVCNLEDGQCDIEECGQLNLAYGVVYGNQYYIGAKLRVSCAEGYVELQGIKQVVCNSTGEWHPTPKCEAEGITTTASPPPTTTATSTASPLPSTTASAAPPPTTTVTTTTTTEQAPTTTATATTTAAAPTPTTTATTTTKTATTPTTTATTTTTADPTPMIATTTTAVATPTTTATTTTATTTPTTATTTTTTPTTTVAPTSEAGSFNITTDSTDNNQVNDGANTGNN